MHPLAGKHIAITRPVDQAKKLSSLIVQAGGSVHLFPLIEIVALENNTECATQIAQLNGFEIAIFISSNAANFGMPLLKVHQPLQFSQLNFFAIGPSTRHTMLGLGAKQVLTPPQKFDSESLLAMPEMHEVKNKKIAIFRGIGGRELLGETLQQRGATVQYIECYRRINPQQNLVFLKQLHQNQQLNGIVITSSEAMRSLLALAEAQTWLSTVPIFVNHARIAEEAPHLQTFVAASTGDDAMLDCLKQYLA